jgi:hypothetical protein
LSSWPLFCDSFRFPSSGYSKALFPPVMFRLARGRCIRCLGRSLGYGRAILVAGFTTASSFKCCGIFVRPNFIAGGSRTGFHTATFCTSSSKTWHFMSLRGSDLFYSYFLDEVSISCYGLNGLGSRRAIRSSFCFCKHHTMWLTSHHPYSFSASP